jgi:DNA-binding MarR family transcriptional regulator
MPDHFEHKGDEFHLLRDVGRTSQVLMTTVSRTMGIPASRFMLMRFLAMNENGIGVTDLAARMEVNPAAIVRLVKEMEDERIVVRRGDPRDKRRNYISLSPKGAKLFEQLHLRSHEMERALAAFIDPKEIAITVRVLAKLREFMESVTHEHADD